MEAFIAIISMHKLNLSMKVSIVTDPLLLSQVLSHGLYTCMHIFPFPKSENPNSSCNKGNQLQKAASGSNSTQFKTFKTKKTIEIQLVIRTEAYGKV